MDRDTEKTVVVFRKWKDGGDIIALFPMFINYPDGRCESYMHVGQHGGADYSHCIAATLAATPKEYAALERELSSIGYNLEVRRKYVRKRVRLTNDDMRDNAANTFHAERVRMEAK